MPGGGLGPRARVFNAITGVTEAVERAEVRAFRPLSEWRRSSRRCRLVDAMLEALEEGDPTCDEMLAFYKPPLHPAVSEEENKRTKGPARRWPEIGGGRRRRRKRLRTAYRHPRQDAPLADPRRRDRHPREPTGTSRVASKRRAEAQRAPADDPPAHDWQRRRRRARAVPTSASPSTRSISSEVSSPRQRSRTISTSTSSTASSF